MKVIGFNEGVRNLQAGFPIIFPTDTLPAIGCIPKYSETIYSLKKRDKNKALILMGAEIPQIIDYVSDQAKDDFKNIAAKFWPGPITLIIPIADGKKNVTTSKDNTLGIRIPKSNSAQVLIQKSGPLLTSSANISGFSTAISANGVANDIPNVEILGPVPWQDCSGKASTIVSWVGIGKWKLIREGEILFNEI
tara:strand:- start:2959 stop:3537 length:579 start_codon:yes stop_codon:yes gene_type:complete